MEKKIHEVRMLQITAESMTLEIDLQKHVFLLAQCSEKLAGSTSVERETYRISASGYGIHWPLLDEDLSVDGLLGQQSQGKITNYQQTNMI